MREKIRALLVDDELDGRERVRALLAADAEIILVGESANGYEALAAIRKYDPELVFLDVQMPEMDGFEVLSELAGERSPHVIFVTAYDQYAKRAFDVNAVDYLVKPFDAERFYQALHKAKSKLTGRGRFDDGLEARMAALLQAMQPRPANYLQQVPVKNNRGSVVFVPTADIDSIEADDKYVKLQVGKHMHLLRTPIHRLEKQLDPQQFWRIHRSYLVNRAKIVEMERIENGAYLVVLRNGHQLPLSDTYRKILNHRYGLDL